MSRRLVFVILLFSVFLIVSCKTSPDGGSRIMPSLRQSIGDHRKIAVLLSTSLMSSYKDSLSGVLSPTYLVSPQIEESLFTFSYYDSEVRIHRRNPNILMIVDKSCNSDIVEYAREATGKISSGFQIKDNVWAKDQKVALIIGDDKEDIKKKIEQYKNDIHETFLVSLYARNHHLLYQQIVSTPTYSKDSEKKLFDELGWSILFPNSYIPHKQSQNPSVRVFARKRELDETNFSRILSVYKEKRESLWTFDEIIDRRNILGEKFYLGDKMVEKTVKRDTTFFKGKKALRLAGLWENKEFTMGGPFRTIAFLDDKTSTGFIIDYYVYAPGKSKTDFLIELETIARTFRYDR
ncbi:MAG: DUF4837 family protein [Candidatus Coatesbacteria bacterium]|nr:DUF4837 family protein [Candidatus Coatesbacteria bacterium]